MISFILSKIQWKYIINRCLYTAARKFIKDRSGYLDVNLTRLDIKRGSCDIDLSRRLYYK